MLRSLISTQPVIHLSFFTGIGVSQLALHYLNSNVAQTFSWEIDPFCNELLDHHYHPNIQHMGDIAATDFEAFCQTLSAQYDTTHIILITAAPPCKDHSRVRDTPPGLAGADGSLLQQMSNIHMIIKQKLPHHTIRSLMENVIPHHTIRPQFQQISQQLGYDPIILDAADGNVTSRPRLWWIDTDWQYILHRLTNETPWTLHWTQHDGYDRLHNPLATLIQPSVHVKDWETPAILCQQQLFHCLTTQAPTDLGRPPPQHTRADDSTWDRWQQDNRQFPPWQYQPQFLTRPHEGEWQPITPLQRERIMALPDHYTHITEQHPSTRSRNTMLGNAWHFPSALWLITILLMIPLTTAIPHTPHRSHIQKLTELWLASHTHHGGLHRDPSTTNTCHNSTGTVTSDGPGHYKNLQQTRTTSIPASAGPSTSHDNYPTYTPSDKGSFPNYKTLLTTYTIRHNIGSTTSHDIANKHTNKAR